MVRRVMGEMFWGNGMVRLGGLGRSSQPSSYDLPDSQSTAQYNKISTHNQMVLA